MRRVPALLSLTRPASFSTRRCCETAGRLTGSIAASSFTARGPSNTQVDLVHSKLERHGEGYEQLLVALRGPEAWSGILADFARVADRTAAL